MKKKQILFLASRFYPSRGGVEKHLLRLSEVLQKQGYHCTVITVQHAPDLSLQEQYKGVTIVRIPQQFEFAKLSLWKWMYQHSELFFEADIVHVHDIGWWVLPLLPHLYKRFYMTFHGWEGIYPVSWKAKLQRFFFAHCARATVHVGQFIQEFYWDRPTVVTYGGYDKKTIHITPSLSKKVLECVFVGRLEKENEIESYISFINTLQSEGVKLHITWIGDGAYHDRCSTVGTVTGMVEEPAKLIENAECILANSYLSLLEAQSQAKVVCSIYTNPLKKVYLTSYPGSSALVLAGSPEELAKKVLNLINNKKAYTALAQKAQKITEPYTWNLVAEQYLSLWGEQR